MGRLFYQPENAWVGDLIPYYENGTYYGFYLHDPRIRDKEYAEETTWHLIETKDFVNLDYKGEAIARGGIHDANKNAYTGSVIKCEKDGLYHVFYTAYNEDFKIRGKAIQSVMQATGKDLENLETVKDFLFVSDGKQYEEFDWRDPFVFWNDEEQCYYMLLASRVTNRGDLRGGCIALCKSEDLINWTYEKPFYDPKMYITMECPELFKMGEYWYLVFSTFSDQFTTHYRISKNWNGPWEIPDDDVFDTRADYAIKTASDGKRRFAFGWIASKYGNTDFGPWEWGGTMNFHEIIQNPNNGELRIKAIPEVLDYFSKEIELKKETLYNSKMIQTQNGVGIESDTLGALLYPLEGDTFALDMVIKPERYHEFGIALHVDKELETGYFLRMNPKNQLVAWDMWPRGEQGRYQWQIKGDVPYQIETARKLPKAEEYRVHIIKEKDICAVYINDEIALSTRMYDHKDGYAGVYVVQGNVNLIQYKEKGASSMSKKVISAMLALGMAGTLLTGCGTATTKQDASADAEKKSEDSGDVTTVKWFTSRPVDGAIDQVMHEIADEYSEKMGGKWKIEFETTADRPSYLQKLKTLIAGGNMPDIIDIDADPYCQELVDAGMLVDMKKFLQDNGKYDDFYPTALKYQEFTDGSMYTLPLEYHVEMTWYNKEIFDKYDLSVPETMDEWLDVCKTLKENGVTPISVDGVDRWPVQRYLAMMPFRESGNDYIINLRDGKEKMSGDEGKEAAAFMQNIGQYFNDGFAATDYATAQSMFLDGKSAMYYIGDWEIAAMQEAYEAGKIDYFYLPTIENGKTDASEFCVNSGIGMAFNTKTFDEKTKDFILYVLDNYGEKYAAKQQMSPIKTELPSDVEFSDLYLKIRDDMDKTGEQFLKPWDTYLDADTNTTMQDNLLLLASGDMSVDDFCKLIDDSLATNAKN